MGRETGAGEAAAGPGPGAGPGWRGWAPRAALAVALVTAVMAGWLLGRGSRGPVRGLLGWLERQEAGVGFLLFALAFTFLSFPWSWGYTPLSLAPGYLYGFQRGLAVLALGVLAGTLLAHHAIQRCLSRHMAALVRDSAKLSAIVRVLDGTSGLKVVFLARLTPIPFGLQNAVFAISKLETFQYLTTSTIGLLPSQILNSYMGSTVRSLEDVVNHQGVEGYLVFALQILISVGMMLYFVRRARHELNNTIKAHDANKQEGMLENGKDRDDVGRTNVASDMDLV